MRVLQTIAFGCFGSPEMSESPPQGIQGEDCHGYLFSVGSPANIRGLSDFILRLMPFSGSSQRSKVVRGSEGEG